MREASARRPRHVGVQSNGQSSLSTLEEQQRHNLGVDLSKQNVRRWKVGDVYAPHDLSEVETVKWKRRERPVFDVFDVLDFRPEDHYRVSRYAFLKI
jgi:small subunit ribosomal protein S18